MKSSTRQAPLVSIVLLDWQVRESFHLFHYLAQQTFPRDRFEVIVVEYYSRLSPALQPYENDVDTWLLLEMPETTYYHKHLMYNAGIAIAHGEIVVFGDSDAMVRESFVQAIATACAAPDTVVHLDQFRNVRRDLYPFRYPPFEEVLGEGCVNNVGGQTRGIHDTTDPLHARNYGACMAARRADLIAIGGADEHRDYLGHICGPYEMTFRLINSGKREVWLDNEFTYHTWHPGQAGEDNWMGPHDGRHMSTTALRALVTGRVLPLEENQAIRSLRRGDSTSPEELLRSLIRPAAIEEWQIGASPLVRAETSYEGLLELYRGASILQAGRQFVVRWPADLAVRLRIDATKGEPSFASLADAKLSIERQFGLVGRAKVRAIATLVRMSHLVELAYDAFRKKKLNLRSLSSKAGSDRVARGVRESAFVSSDIANLIAALLLSPRQDSSLRAVVVLGAGEALVIRGCMAVGLLPRCRVARINNAVHASTLVMTASRDRRRLLVSAGAFVRFHEKFSLYRRADLLIA